ncbi:MAG: BamA/TamA family outer membrane protein [Bacteroidota bacterium]|nr:BamA/TamA family outer membrane protein [Bacteroidota bacterium]
MLYTAVPRDRDKVYYNTSGVLPWVLSHQWLKSNLQSYSGKVRDIAGYNFNNRYFDRYFLTALNENDWKEEIKYLQTKITDSLIRQSVRLMPDTIYALSGEKIIKTLIARRADVEKQALNYYRFISKYVDIPASDKHELFDIENKPGGDVAVTIFKIKKDGTKDKVIFKRTFNAAVTKEIRLYGFAGRDVFSVSGQGMSPIKVRMIGGADRDSFYVSNHVDNKGKLYVYDRSDEENVLPAPYKVTVRTSTDSTVNGFDKHAFKYDQLGPVGLVQYNLDQGFQFRGGIIYEKHGFRKEPYAVRHEIYGNYSTGRKAFMFTYSGDIKKVFGNTDLLINVLSRGPHNISNFYGIGNETEFLKTGTKGIDFYRNRYDYLNADILLKRLVQKHLRLSAGVAGQYYNSADQNNTGHFLNIYNSLHPGEAIFSTRYYAGLVTGAELDTRNHFLLPASGIYWTTGLRAMQEINGDKKSYGLLRTDISFYLPVFRDSNIVIINRLGAGTTVGNPTYFQQMQLGGVQNLRGFHSIRFTGNTMFYHSIQARLKLFDFTSYLLPGSFGLIGFHDVGRVWVPGEKSDKWHNGYGGGIYVIPADLVLIQLFFGHSIEGTQPYITVGFNF